MVKMSVNFVILGLFLLFGPFPGETAPQGQGWGKGRPEARRLDPSRPWLTPQNNWGQGWGNGRPEARRLDPSRPGLSAQNNWGQGWGKGFERPGGIQIPIDPYVMRKFQSMDKVEAQSMKLDPTRPWLKPSNNWGQGGTKPVMRLQGVQKYDPSRPWMKPSINSGQGFHGGNLHSDGWKPPRVNPDETDSIGADIGDPVGRRLDPTRPWLKPGNNGGHGWKPPRKPLKPGNGYIGGNGCRPGRPCKFKLLGRKTIW